jgi:hypothetical protein
MIKNWKEQMAIARQTYDRGMRTATLENYSAGMVALQPLCE